MANSCCGRRHFLAVIGLSRQLRCRHSKQANPWIPLTAGGGSCGGERRCGTHTSAEGWAGSGHVISGSSSKCRRGATRRRFPAAWILLATYSMSTSSSSSSPPVSDRSSRFFRFRLLEDCRQGASVPGSLQPQTIHLYDASVRGDGDIVQDHGLHKAVVPLPRVQSTSQLPSVLHKADEDERL